MPSYPAVILAKDEASGLMSVLFPDLPGCLSCGETLEDCQEMAEDALSLYCDGLDPSRMPAPSPLGFIPDWIAELGGDVAAHLMITV